MQIKKATFSLSLILVLVTCGSSYAAHPAPSWSKTGMAATPHWAATEAAVEAMELGGNAVDAVVAAAFALAVVEPYHSGLGGGEFTLLWLNSDKQVRVLDARESAPLKSTPEMFIEASERQGNSFKSWIGGLAIGVPGSVAGRVELIEKYGNLSLSQVIQPAIKLAKDGFPLDRTFASQLKYNADRFAENPATASVFISNGTAIGRGETLKQPQLANTLARISADNGKSFYHSDDAKAIARACQNADGILTTNDLSKYKLIWREPIEFQYRDCTIFSMPPPSSGGVGLAQILNILSGFPLGYVEQGSSEYYHLVASAFERTFADRSKWLGDADFAVIPVEGLTSLSYADDLRKQINRRYRNLVQEAGNPWMFFDDGNTSHISVIDKDGNMCAMTTSVNSSFGSKVFVPELGIFLNSTMDDFNTIPDAGNHFDLQGGDVNLIEPGKRPLSSMSPTLVFRDEVPYMSVGSVGGPRIITSVAQILINVIDYKMDVQKAIDSPRIHAQWKPDKLYMESEIPPEVVEKLQSMGWITNQSGHWSLSQAVMFNSSTGEFFGASDSRGVGSSAPNSDKSQP